MSKGVNSSLPSGGADRRDAPGGDADRNAQDNEHCDKLDAHNANEEEPPSVHTRQPVPVVFPPTPVHVAD